MEALIIYIPRRCKRFSTFFSTVNLFNSQVKDTEKWLTISNTDVPKPSFSFDVIHRQEMYELF